MNEKTYGKSTSGPQRQAGHGHWVGHVRDIAKRAGVSRQTINTWRNHDQDFRALLAER
jgi:hypothetical protein